MPPEHVSNKLLTLFVTDGEGEGVMASTAGATEGEVLEAITRRQFDGP